MTEKANVCMEILRKAAHVGSSFDCHDCPAYVACPTGTAGWNNECIFDTAADLIESLSAELEQTENKLSELLYYVTGGRFSKTDYSTDDMRRFVDDYNQSVCSECEELEQVKRERDAAVEDLKEFCSCHHCQHYKRDCNDKCYFVTGLKPDWQWRGVREE